MAQQDPAWLNYITGATGRRNQASDNPLLNFSLSGGMRTGGSSRGPLTLPVEGIPLSPEDARLAQNEDLKKQVDRLDRAETSAAIVGAEAERPRGLLGWFKDTARDAAVGAVTNPVVKGIFQAMNVLGSGLREVYAGVDWANDKSLGWLVDRMDEYTYGRVRTQEEREQAIERRLEGTIDFVSPLPGDITSRAAAQVGEFATTELGMKAAPTGSYGAPSLQRFKENVSGIRGGGEIIPEFQLQENAGILEKAWKLPLAFIYDVASAGGPTGFVRFGTSAMSRKQVGETLGNASDDVFKKYAKQGADETTEAFNDRASMFAAKVTAANLGRKGGSVRSRGVKDVFEAEFGEKVGREAFGSLPKDLRGGLGVGPADARIGNLNAGGYAVDAVARALKLDPKLFGTMWNPIVGYQALKNNARVTQAARFLNNIGIESSSWANFVRATAKGAGDEDLLIAYKEFMTPAARDPAGRLAEILSEELIPSKQFLLDLAQIHRTQPALYDRVNQLVRDPDIIAGKESLDEFDRMALNYAVKYKELYDQVHARFIDEGMNVNYLNEFSPAIFDTAAMKKDGIEFSDIFNDEYVDSDFIKSFGSLGKKREVTEAGVVNLPGKPYDPTKDRSIFIRDITEPDGPPKFRAASLKEMEDEMRAAGIKEEHIKYLKTNPAEVLTDYADRAAKVIARRKLVNELHKAGLLFRGNVPRVTASYKMIEGMIAQMRPDQLERLTKDFMRDPERFDQYVGQVNDRLARAYDAANPQAIADADKEVKNIMDALSRLGDIYIERVMTPKALANYRRLVDAHDEAVDMGDTQAAQKLRIKIEQAKRDAMKIREEKAGTRQATVEANVERKAFEDYIASTLGIKELSAGEIKRRYNLSNLSPLTNENIRGTSRIPDELAGTIASENLNNRLGQWLEWNTRYALDDATKFNFLSTLNAATQGFRTGATFGGGPGFVQRNGIGATFSNFMTADARMVDYTDGNRIWWTRLTTDVALSPLEKLTGREAEKYLEKLISRGGLSEDAAALARADIINLSKVGNDTIAKIRVQANIDRLSQYKVKGYDHTLADGYTANVEAGVYDPYQSVAVYSGLKREQSLPDLLKSDPDWLSIRNDRKAIRSEVTLVQIPGTSLKVKVKKPTMSIKKTEDDPRSIFQRGTETALNAGFDVEVGGRVLNLRPVQIVRDMNKNMEEIHRGAAVLAGLRKYGTTENGRKNAAANMRLAQFDYSNLTEAERSFGRFALPFYTWMRYNIPLQIRLLVNKPGSFNTVLEGWETIQGIFGDPNGDMYFMPEYAQEAFAFMVNPELQEKLGPLMSVLGSDPENPIAVRLESPILDLNKYFTEDGLDYEEIVSGMNPFVKAFIQFNAERNLYTGRTYSAEGVEAPAWYTALSSVIGRGPLSTMQPIWDPEDQVYKVNEKWLDVFKTVLPMATTYDRTVIPAAEAALKAAGYDVNLSNEDEKVLTSILSKGLGAPVTTVTPETEAGEVASRYRYAEDQILTTARRQKIDERKVREFVANAEKAGMSEADVIRRGRALAESGFFM